MHARGARGLSEAQVRLPASFGPEQVRDALKKAFVKLFNLYSNVTFEVTVSANVLVQGTESDGSPSYSVFAGTDHGAWGEESRFSSPVYIVRSLSDIRKIQTSFSLNDFEALFRRAFTQSNVTLFQQINLVYMIRRVLKDYSRDKATKGKTHQRLF